MIGEAMAAGSALNVEAGVGALMKAAKGRRVSCLEGYVGASDAKSIRLYGSLSLTYYADIDKSDILHSRVVPGRSDGSVQIFTDSETQIDVHTIGKPGGVTVVARRLNDTVGDVNMCIIGCWQKHSGDPAKEKVCTDACMKKLPKTAGLFVLTR
jgi:hypothetical protein